ncbi:hypothetical protein AB0368_02640 [Actinoplanes sp. NPDC051475]|uniref:hypothetical protein n=1 Tax=Actinoplanes sp. NPDC051475 TaxID=3157225 RepID=UPI00344ED440
MKLQAQPPGEVRDLQQAGRAVDTHPAELQALRRELVAARPIGPAGGGRSPPMPRRRPGAARGGSGPSSPTGPTAAGRPFR